MTKPIIVVKVKGFSLISEILVAYNRTTDAASDWHCTILQPRCFV